MTAYVVINTKVWDSWPEGGLLFDSEESAIRYAEECKAEATEYGKHLVIKEIRLVFI